MNIYNTIISNIYNNQVTSKTIKLAKKYNKLMYPKPGHGAMLFNIDYLKTLNGGNL